MNHTPQLHVSINTFYAKYQFLLSPISANIFTQEFTLANN